MKFHVSVLLSAMLVPAVASVVSAAPPNVIVILSDDQGWGDLSLHGNTNLKTPNLDTLATAGARASHFFVQPVCSPTRAEFLTGRYHARGGVRGVTSGGERLNLTESTIADCFRKAGYATGCFGKWHNGSQYPYHPNGRGFGEYYGFTSGHWADYFDAPLDHNGKPVVGKGYVADDFTDKAIGFIRESSRAGKPFFTYLAFNTPHSPMQVPDTDWDRFKNAELRLKGSGKENLNHTRAALAMVENLDRNVARVLQTLRDTGLETNTIVVYFNDNGPNGQRWNGGMKGVKGSVDEGGVRSPLHVRWTGTIPPGTIVEPIAGAIDLLPTLLSLTGVPRVGQEPLDGIDLSPWLLGKRPALPDRVLYQAWNGRISVRSQRYRLDPAGALFDMIEDPNQTKNVADNNPEIARLMREHSERWKAQVYDHLGKADDRPFPIGHREFPRTVLPARDGTPHGEVRRSANAPNCSFFTNWKTTKDTMTWSVEIATAGRYEAILHYTCAEPDIGSDVSLSLASAAWNGTIKVAHDPPLRGKDQDRVPRVGESYMKDFRPLSLGMLELKPGRGTLTLSASRVAGKSVADLRSVELILRP